MNKEMIMGLLRHLLTFGGGVVAERGLASGQEVTAGVAAIVTIVGLVWCILNKRK